MATVYREGPWLDSVKRVWSHFSYRDTRKVYDAEVITADYLIDNIDHAFEVWGKRPWAKYYSFDDFCEYVLPYRIANEPLEAWRRVYYDRYAATVDSMYGGSDVLEVVKAVRKKFKEEDLYGIPTSASRIAAVCSCSTTTPGNVPNHATSRSISSAHWASL